MCSRIALCTRQKHGDAAELHTQTLESDQSRLQFSAGQGNFDPFFYGLADY